jgi:hypothetical protein
VLEFVKELLGGPMLGLQGADEFQHVLVGQHVRRRGRETSQQMIDHGALEVGTFARQISDAVGRVGDHLGTWLAAVAFQVDGRLQQRIEGSGDEQVEIGDLRQFPQRLGRLDVNVAHDGAQARVGFLAPAVLAQMGAHHVVQRERLGQGGRIHGQVLRQFLSQPLVQWAQSVVGLHAQQIGSDDRDDPVLFYIVKQVIPSVFVEDLCGVCRGEQRCHGKRYLLRRAKFTLTPSEWRAATAGWPWVRVPGNRCNPSKIAFMGESDSARAVRARPDLKESRTARARPRARCWRTGAYGWRRARGHGRYRVGASASARRRISGAA